GDLALQLGDHGRQLAQVFDGDVASARGRVERAGDPGVGGLGLGHYFSFVAVFTAFFEVAASATVFFEVAPLFEPAPCAVRLASGVGVVLVGVALAAGVVLAARGRPFAAVTGSAPAAAAPPAAEACPLAGAPFAVAAPFAVGAPLAAGAASRAFSRL